jgi:hypothetical protein
MQAERALTTAECLDLQCVAGAMVPASSEFGVPGADDAAIFADIVASLGRDFDDVRQALSELAVLAGGSFAAVEVDHRDALVTKFHAQSGDVAITLGRVILQCYYRDDRVLHALGLEPGPPFPRGRALDQGDWSLLKPIYAMTPLWRDDRQHQRDEH